MYIHATAPEYRSKPVHGPAGADAPRIAVSLHLELTQEEAAAVLTGFAIGLDESHDAEMTPAQLRQTLTRVITDLTMHKVRTAANDAADLADPDDTAFLAWCRRLVGRLVPVRRTATRRQLAGTGAAR
ncbi:hypothetical protein ITP53_17325 [Nonomuraea sp. K274]|uniref:Uncharacterized protein n=1 Tax=Nonomuraea cypriaca TaxID=1187855 RepID=A0A931AA72_9ACTN|nr:hypothetical protein [Nonomuraea cypriaca]MBF8187464.1 hypothetical protein [Nonomuraea cypriaca]